MAVIHVVFGGYYKCPWLKQIRSPRFVYLFMLCIWQDIVVCWMMLPMSMMVVVGGMMLFGLSSIRGIPIICWWDLFTLATQFCYCNQLHSHVCGMWHNNQHQLICIVPIGCWQWWGGCVKFWLEGDVWRGSVEWCQLWQRVTNLVGRGVFNLAEKGMLGLVHQICWEKEMQQNCWVLCELDCRDWHNQSHIDGLIMIYYY